MAMPVQKALTAIVIDSNTIARHRLKQVCHSLDEFDHLDQSSDLKTGAERLSTKHVRIDIIFISTKLPHEEIKEFIKSAKQLESAADAAFVLIMEINHKGETAEATTFLLGGDGVLYEPFSTDQLREISALALRVRHDRTQKRLAAHLQGIVGELFGMLGDIAFLKESNFAFGPVIKEIKKVGAVIEGLEADQTEMYYDALILRSERGPSPAPKYPEYFKYGGKSKRARRRMQKRTLKALGYEAAE